MTKRPISKSRKLRYGSRKRRKEPRMSGAPNTLLKPYQLITERIIAMLEQGTVPWRKPWHGGGLPKSLQSGKEYRGVNVFLLNCVAHGSGYASPYWLTFNQVKSRGGHVKKGEHGTPVVFWKMLEKESDHGEDDAPDTDASPKKIPMLRTYVVFNVAQCEGIEFPQPTAPAQPFDPLILCEQIVQGMPRPPTIRHGESRAYYRPSDDLVNMPAPELFSSNAEYYATLFHELTHATGHPSRLNRESIQEMAPFGSVSYAKEELIAEMGAAFLCGRTGIEQTTLENSAAYIQGWLAKLRSEPRLVVLAAAAAQKAVDHITNAAVREMAATSVLTHPGR